MTDKLEDTSLRLKDEMDLYRKMMDKLRQNRLQFQKEKEEMQEVGGTILSGHSRCLHSASLLFPADAAQRCLSPFSLTLSLPLSLLLQLIEDLRRELEHLQLFKLETERPGRGRSSSSGLADFNCRTRETELEHEVKRLKQVEMDSFTHAFLCFFPGAHKHSGREDLA